MTWQISKILEITGSSPITNIATGKTSPAITPFHFFGYSNFSNFNHLITSTTWLLLSLDNFYRKWDFERPNPKTETTFHANIPPKWWIRHLFHVFTTFGWEINKFWILHIFTSFSHEHGPFFSKWWTSQENAKKIIFFAEVAYIHVGTKYIKRPWDFENFLEVWCTLL